MNQDDHLAVLKDETKNLVERVRSAVLLKLDYWDDPNKSPPNLSLAEFKKVLNFIPLGVPIRWEIRTSSRGEFGLTGEDQVFNINFDISRGKYKHFYYLKGYFFEKNDLKGVCIQSFRIEKSISRQRLKVL